MNDAGLLDWDSRSSGGLAGRGQFWNGLPDGAYELYNKDGGLRESGTYRKGVRK